MPIHILQQSGCPIAGGLIELTFDFSEKVTQDWLDCLVIALNELGALDESECSERNHERIKVRCHHAKAKVAIATLNSAVTVANFACSISDSDSVNIHQRARDRAAQERRQ